MRKVRRRDTLCTKHLEDLLLCACCVVCFCPLPCRGVGSQQELGETKKDKAEAAECMAAQKGDLGVASADLKKASETKASVEEGCSTTEADHK
eukprot:2307746-Amphidinium_carterae.1